MYKYIEIVYIDMIYCEIIILIKWLVCDNRFYIYSRLKYLFDFYYYLLYGINL